MLEVGKKYVTRDKKLPARVLCTDLCGRLDCVAVAILDSDGTEKIFTYYPDGRLGAYTGTDHFDLIEMVAS